MKKEDILDSDYFDKILKIAVLFVYISWVFIFFYLLAIKAPHYSPSEYPMEKLGQAGDFFNITTSLASLVTVVLVYSAYRLQKKELREMKEQISKEEKINRTLSFVDKWQEIINKNGFNDFSQDEFNFINVIVVLSQADKEYKNHIDLRSICHILIESNIDKRLSLEGLPDDQVEIIDIRDVEQMKGILNFIKANAYK